MVHSFVNSRFKFESPEFTPSCNSLPISNFHTLEIGPSVTHSFLISSALFTKHRGVYPILPVLELRLSRRDKTDAPNAPGGLVDHRPHQTR